MVDIIVTVVFWAVIAVFVLGILGTMLLPFITAWSWISLTRSEWRIARATCEQAQALQQRAQWHTQNGDQNDDAGGRGP